MNTLNISLIHYRVRYKQADQNKNNLLELISTAANNGANIILSPEMSVSGYSFSDRDDIISAIEEENGIFLEKIRAIALDCCCYICVGLALRDVKTNAYHNSCYITGPEGFTFRYNKINAELRWAKPGDPCQTAVFDTPWGKVGVLICSDTYYELPSRIIALQGADLLLVPANWPTAGLDPVELWRARALENGIAIAACNRTGEDLNMDCTRAESCLIGSDGTLLFRQHSAKSSIFALCLPLKGNRLCSTRRIKQLSSRYPEQYHSCYKNIGALEDISSFLDLPSPGLLAVNCLVPRPSGNLAKHVSDFFSRLQKISTPSLWLLPAAPYSETFLQMLDEISGQCEIWLLVQQLTTKAKWHLFGPTGTPQPVLPQKNTSGYIQLDIGPARLALIPFSALRHPESALAASKDGCDLIVSSSNQFNDDIKLLCGVRTINHMAVALCTNSGAGIWMRPEGHGRWQETLCKAGKSCTFILDTHLTRKKRFQDRVDFDQLFTENNTNDTKI